MLFFESTHEDELIYQEAQASTYIIRDELYPIVHTILNTPQGDMRFKRLVGNFIDRNSDRLKTPGPQYMILFADTDKKEFFDLFGLDSNDIVKMVIKITQALNGSEFKFLRQNPIYWLFFCCIRFYTLKKDTRGLNTALAIYALSAYPSIFQKYFKYGVSSPGTMEYTINTMNNKFIIKKQGHVFGALTYSIGQSYNFLRMGITDGSDAEAIRFIQRIRNDQNSMMKKICDQYTKNHAKGLTIASALDTGEEGQMIDSYENDTTQVESTVQSIVLPILTNGVNLNYVTACAKMSQISVSEVRFYLTKIIVNDQAEAIKNFVEAIIFIWLYSEKKSKKEINSSEFLVWASKLFRKTNSNDENISTIKNTLNEWGDISGLHQKFKREASRINYKKAIFYYFILSIQYYNN